MIFRLAVRLHLVWLRIVHWFFDAIPEPEEALRDDVYVVEPELPKALHRLKEMGFRYQACGHNAYCWNAVRGECEQCVLEGRSASRDMGRNK